MEREIKFRGKKLDKDEWVYGYLVHIGKYYSPLNESSCYIVTGVQIDSHTWVDPETVGQSTGLKDKNGKEIWEGDIVSRGEYYFGDCLEPAGNDDVSFDDGCFFGGNGELDSANIHNKNIEVIGNIHSNPELMEEKK